MFSMESKTNLGTTLHVHPYRGGFGIDIPLLTQTFTHELTGVTHVASLQPGFAVLRLVSAVTQQRQT